MTLTLVVYAHLIATCAAIGTIVITDLRLMAKVLGYRVVIPRPEKFETITISAALTLLYLSGGMLVWFGLGNNPEYLSNPKLQAKLVLVAILTANAFWLHWGVFPILSKSKPVSWWKRREWLTVAVSVSLSNSLWFYCAFLGIARVWNFKEPLEFVLVVAAAVWATMFFAVNAVLLLASRDAPKERPDWIDSVKVSLSGWASLGEEPAASGRSYSSRL